jgi:hypothetical protein
MAFNDFTDDLNIVSALPDRPNDEAGLDAAAFKAKFDEGPNKIKTWLNSALLPDLRAAAGPWQIPTTVTGDFNDCTVGGIYWCMAPNADHNPGQGRGWLIVLRSEYSTYNMQLFIPAGLGTGTATWHIMARAFSPGGAFADWRTVV